MAFPSRHSLFPFLTWLPRQTRASVGRDLIVGLSGAILALPQSIAYALIAGLPPEYGLYAAIIPVLIACLWGSSWHLICGPTAAISIVLYASVSPLAVPASQDYVTLILLLTLLAGIFPVVAGFAAFRRPGEFRLSLSGAGLHPWRSGGDCHWATAELAGVGCAQPGHGAEQPGAAVQSSQ